MNSILVEGLAARGVSALPSGIELVVGLPAAKRRLGATLIAQIQATSRFNKRVRRSDWAPYVVEDSAGRYVVTCPDPAALPKHGWMSSPAIDAALDHVAYLVEHGRPWPCPTIVEDVRDFEVPSSGVVGIDIEGPQGSVDRVGIATATQTLTCQWDQRAAHLVREIASCKDITLVAHNAPFDSCGLEAEMGMALKPHCTMVATRLVNPWRQIGIGKAAPLYVPGLQPWKHLEKSDPALYNAMDAAVLVPMWASLQATIDDHKLHRAYAEDLVAEYEHFAWGNEMEDRLQHSVNWVETTVTRASGIIESKSQGSIDGLGMAHAVQFWNTVGEIVGPGFYDGLIDMKYHAIIYRHVLGYGPRQIRCGGQEFPAGVEGLPDGCKDKCIKEITAAFDEANPKFVAWRDRLRRQNRKDGYVTALDGRRFYGGRDGQLQRFVIFAEIGRRLKRTLPFRPRYINHEVVVSAKADDRILEALRD